MTGPPRVVSHPDKSQNRLAPEGQEKADLDISFEAERLLKRTRVNLPPRVIDPAAVARLAAILGPVHRGGPDAG